MQTDRERLIDGVRRCAAEGLTIAETAQRLEIHRSYVSVLAWRLRRGGETIIFGARRERLIDGVRRCAAEGLTIAETAQRLEIHRSYVCVLAERLRRGGETIIFGRAVRERPSPEAEVGDHRAACAALLADLRAAHGQT